MSWKTSLAGIVAVLAGLGMFGSIISDFSSGAPISFSTVAAAVSTVGAGFGLIFARDNDVTSEETGAK